MKKSLVEKNLFPTVSQFTNLNYIYINVCIYVYLDRDYTIFAKYFEMIQKLQTQLLKFPKIASSLHYKAYGGYSLGSLIL